MVHASTNNATALAIVTASDVVTNGVMATVITHVAYVDAITAIATFYNGVVRVNLAAVAAIQEDVREQGRGFAPLDSAFFTAVIVIVEA